MNSLHPHLVIQTAKHFSLGDSIVGILFVITGIIFLEQYKKSSPSKKLLTFAALGMLIVGFLLLLWVPINSLVD